MIETMTKLMTISVIQTSMIKVSCRGSRQILFHFLLMVLMMRTMMKVMKMISVLMLKMLVYSEVLKAILSSMWVLKLVMERMMMISK